MKKLLLIIVIILCFSNISFSQSKNYSDGEAIVVFRAPEGLQISASSLGQDGEIRASIMEAASEVESEIIDVYETISEIDGNIFVLVKSKTKSTEELINALKLRDDVITASPNYILKTQSQSQTIPNDTNYDKLWGLESIRVPEVWNETTGSENIYSAVIDLGFYKHEDLRANFAENLGYNALLKFNDYWETEDSEHGTHVAGTIGAVGNNNLGVTGVNWKVKIIPIALIGDIISASSDPRIDIEVLKQYEDTEFDNNMFLNIVANGLNYLSSLLINSPDMKIASVNMSVGYGSYESPEEMKNNAFYLMFKAFDNLNKTLMIVSAGNEGLEVGKPAPFNDPKSEQEFLKDQYVYPASFSGLNNFVVVSAFDSNDNPAYFTNWGDSVDIAAPGVDIFSTIIPNENNNFALYESSSGTSMAAPFVTGAAALLLSKYPNATTSQIKNALLKGANTQKNKLTHPADYKSRIKAFLEMFTMFSYDEAVEYYETGKINENSVLQDILDRVRKESETYQEIDGKGYVSKNGLLDVKAAFDILADEMNKSQNTSSSSSSSGGSCNSGFGVIMLSTAILLIRRKK